MTSRLVFLIILFAVRALPGRGAGDGSWKLDYPPWGESNGRPIIWFPLIGPFTRNGCFPSRYMAMRIAVNHVNRRDSTVCPAIASLTSDFEFRYDIADNNGNGIGAASASLKFAGNATRKVKVVLGPNGSGASKASSQILAVFGIPQISWAATSADLSNKANYPTYFRVVSPDSLTMKVLAGLLHSLMFKSANSAHFDSDFTAGQARDFRQSAEADYQIAVNPFSIPASGKGGAKVSDENMIEVRKVLRAIRGNGIRLVVALAIGEEAWDLWFAAYELGMINAPGWLWFGADGIVGGQLAGNVSRVDIFAGTLLIMSTSRGPLFDGFRSRWQQDMTATQTPEFNQMPLCYGDVVCTSHPEFTGWQIGNHDEDLVCQAYTALAYDAVVTLAVVADRLIKGSGGAPRDPDTLTASDWLEEMTKLSQKESFECLSGEVGFNENQERPLPMSFFNWQPGSLIPVEVARWSDASGYSWFVGAHLLWPSGANGTIVDASFPPHVPSGLPPPCGSGQFFNSTAQLCQRCAKGSRAVVDADGMSSCVLCDRGRAQPNAGAVTCVSCDKGKFAGSDGRTACEECVPGFVQIEQGGDSCVPCAAGSMAGSGGSSECSRCEVGTFAPGLNNSECSSCPPGTTTEFPGSAKVSECACAAGQYLSTKLGQCVPCKEGMTCGFGSREDGIGQEGVDAVVPMVKAGYYSDASDPLSIYQCFVETWCPGGLPGSCSGDREGLVCAVCPVGKSPEPGGCADCSSLVLVVWVVVGIGGLLGFPLGTYYTVNEPLKEHADVSVGVTCASGIIVTTIQVLGMFAQLTVAWPRNANAIFSGIATVFFDGESSSLECVLGNDPAFAYFVRFISPFVVLIVFFLFHLLTQLLGPWFAWNWDMTINSAGQFVQVMFIAIVAISVLPFQCYSHPNGAKSVQKYSNVVCFESEHVLFVVMAIAFLLVYVIPFSVLSGWATYVASDKGHAHLVRFRYMMFKFRPDVWWWGNVFQIRQLLLAFAPTIQPDDPTVQVIYLITIFTCYLGLVAVYSPWKSQELNLLDMLSSAILLLVAACAGSFMDRSQFADVHAWVMFGLILFAFALFFGYIVFSAVTFYFNGLFGHFGLRYPRSKSCTDLAEELLTACNLVVTQSPQHVQAFVESANDYDRYAIDVFISVMQVYQLDGAKHKISTKTVPRLSLTRTGTQSTMTNASERTSDTRSSVPEMFADIQKQMQALQSKMSTMEEAFQIVTWSRPSDDMASERPKAFPIGAAHHGRQGPIGEEFPREGSYFQAEVGGEMESIPEHRPQAYPTPVTWKGVSTVRGEIS